MVVCPSVFGHIRSSVEILDIPNMFFFTRLKRSFCFPSVAPKKICTRDSIDYVALLFRIGSEFRDWKMTLKCGQCVSGDWDIMLFENS